MLTGASASNGLLRPSSFAHSRTCGNTSWPSRRMQVMESRCETFPSLPHTAMMPGRVSSSRWRMRGGGIVVELPDALRLLNRRVERDIGVALLGCPDDRLLADDAWDPHARIRLLQGQSPRIDDAVLIVRALPAERAGHGPGLHDQV